MRRTTRRSLIGAGLCLAAAPLIPPLWAGDRDHDRARAAVARGEALPLAEILNRVGPSLGGEVIEVSLEREKGRWLYEFMVIEAGGRLAEVHVDAATAEILKREHD